MKAFIDVICPYCEKQIALQDIIKALMEAALPKGMKTPKLKDVIMASKKVKK